MTLNNKKCFLNVPLNEIGMKEHENFDIDMHNVYTIILTETEYDLLDDVFDDWNNKFNILIDIFEEETLSANNTYEAMEILKQHISKNKNPHFLSAAKKLNQALSKSIEVNMPLFLDFWGDLILKNTYCYQKYLLQSSYINTSFTSVLLSNNEAEKIQDYNIPYNLFDYMESYKRKISTDILDKEASTYEKFHELADKVNSVDELILIDNRINTDNPIICNYAEATLKAYVHLFKKNGIKHITVAKIF